MESYYKYVQFYPRYINKTRISKKNFFIAYDFRSDVVKCISISNTANFSNMAEVEETYTTGHEVVLADMDNDFVAEEVVVVDASGGQAINTAPVSSAISAPNGRKDVNGTLDSFDASNIVEVNEEEIHLDDGSEEMSVAIDLAKLSQGHFSHNDFKNSGYVSFIVF